MSDATFDRAASYIEEIPFRTNDSEVIAVRFCLNRYDFDSPKSEVYRSHAVQTLNALGTPTVVLWPQPWETGQPHKAVYILDDGHTAQAWYVAGWTPFKETLFLNPFPMNYDPKGAPVRRTDNDSPVDYGGWMLGVRKAYHVKVTRDFPREMLRRGRVNDPAA